jgi:hypothetical protein
MNAKQIATLEKQQSQEEKDNSQKRQQQILRLKRLLALSSNLKKPIEKKYFLKRKQLLCPECGRELQQARYWWRSLLGGRHIHYFCSCGYEFVEQIFTSFTE